MLSPDELRRAGVERIVGTGSALARNPILQSEIESQFGLPLEVRKDVDSATGAALIVRDAKWDLP